MCPLGIVRTEHPLELSEGARPSAKCRQLVGENSDQRFVYQSSAEPVKCCVDRYTRSDKGLVRVPFDHAVGQPLLPSPQ